MIWFLIKHWKAVGVVLICVGLWGHGFITGSDRCETAHALVEAKAAEQRAKTLAALAAAEQRNRLLALELEDAARAEPPAATACLPRSRVVRLNER